jgi:addiction module HigA family antidote
MLYQASIFIVEPNTRTRTRLKEALRSVVSKLQCSYAVTITEAVERLEESPPYDYLFASSRYSQYELDQLTLAAKKNAGNKTISLVVILRAAEKGESHVASLLVQGAQGFVCEPFSSGEIFELLKQSRSIASQAYSQEEMAASSAWLILGAAISLLDSACEQILAGNAAGGRARKELREETRSLKKIVELIGVEKFTQSCYGRFEDLKTTKAESKVRVHIGGPAPHPGELLHERLQDKNLAVGKISTITKIPEEVLQAIVDQKHDISDEHARKISLAIGGSAEYWIKLQVAYDRSPKGRAAAAASAMEVQGIPTE